MTQAQQIATAASIFGAGAARQMTAVIDGGSKAFDAATKSVNKHGSAQEAAAKQSKTLAVEFKTVKAAVEDVAASLGSVLVPALELVMKALMPVIDAFVWVAQKIVNNKPLFYALAGVITALFIPALYEMVAGMVEATADAIVMGATFVATWAAILWPVAAVLAAIALVAGIVYEVIDNWSAIAHFFEKLWHDIEHIFDEARHFISAVFDDLIHWIEKHWQLLVEILLGPIAIVILHWKQFAHDIASIFDDVRHYIAHIWDDISNGAYNVTMDIVHFFESLPGKIVHVIESGAKSVLNAFEKMIPGGGLIGGALNVIGLATGGVVHKPTLAVIGEAGPEAVVPLSKWGSVSGSEGIGALPTSGASSGAPGGMRDINVTLNAANMSPHEVANELSWKVKTGEMSI